MPVTEGSDNFCIVFAFEINIGIARWRRIGEKSMMIGNVLNNDMPDLKGLNL